MISTRKHFSKYVVLILVSTSYLFWSFRIPKLSTRRSLYKLRLKFVQTTAEVCTDFAEVLSLGNVVFAFALHIK